MLISVSLATLGLNLASTFGAAALTRIIRDKQLAYGLSFAIGVLLAMAFLDLIPQALERLSFSTIAGVMAATMAALGLLDHLSLRRRHGQDLRAPYVLGGDGAHNFVDGIIIGLAFVQDPSLGWLTAIAILAHEIPQELSDFLILRASGYSLAKAVRYNLISGMTVVIGGLCGAAGVSYAMAATPYALAISAAMLIYVAIVPTYGALNKRCGNWERAGRYASLALGVGLVAVVAS